MLETVSWFAATALIAFVVAKLVLHQASKNFEFGRISSEVWTRIMPYKIIICRHGKPAEGMLT